MFDTTVSDDHLGLVLAAYASMVHQVLADPDRWLSSRDEPAEAAVPSWRSQALRKVGQMAKGDIAPGDPDWESLSASQRTDWWVQRLRLVGAAAVAAPRYAGLLGDRLPLQAALGASVSGLAVCATAREYGVTTPEGWVPLLARVLFERELSGGS